ncbi:MICAL-like protein isoform 2-T3 [Cochliomyia hominivorax]
MSERRGTKALELWCRRITEGYSGVQIDNMTTSWRDGLAFCAMIHHFRPDLIDFEKLNKSDIYYNNTLAFTTAEKYLGIPALLDADDMAAFEVPDRLSILTYLSQFYQVFAAQEAHNRLKRTSSSSAADKTPLTKPSGPPSKMAHVVGVPKREPCRKCQLPVFLAERLVVGKSVYHRTCLKCARCGYQLTPGSFYETEVDEQYCCETCPDEEISKESHEQLQNKNIEAAHHVDVELRNQVKDEQLTSVLSSINVRSSIRDRLAFFENQGQENISDAKLFPRSLSDEEKSQSVYRMENSTCNIMATYKPNTALSNFLNKTVDYEEDQSEHSSFIQNSNMETSDSENDLINISLPPELPKSLPPLDFSMEKKSQEQRKFSASAQLILETKSNLTESYISTKTNNANEENTIMSEALIESSELQTLTININDKANNNNINNKKCKIENTVQDSNKLENKLLFNEINDNDYITKEKSTEQITMEKTNDESHIKTITGILEISTKLNLNNEMESKCMPDGQSKDHNIVELRTNPQQEEYRNIPQQLEDTEITARLSVVRDRLQEFKEIPNSEKQNNYIDDEIHKLINNDECLNTLLLESSKNETIDNNQKGDDIVPLKIKNIDNGNLAIKEDYLETNTSQKNINEIRATLDNGRKINPEQYPEDLNPFKSDDEDPNGLDNNKENFELRLTNKKNNLNPFDSSDDEVELEKIQNLKKSMFSTPKVPPPRPPPPRISKNPFDSEDEDDEHFHRRSSLTGSQERKIPVPTPRSNISQSQNPTPEPTPRLSTKINSNTNTSGISITKNNSSIPTLKNSSEYYGSSNSLHSNNATPHYLLRNSEVRSSSSSINLSAGGTVRSRKSRRAPLPPAPVKELFPSNETINSCSKTSTPSSSTVGSPKSARKKRPAPAPPKPSRLEASQFSQVDVDTLSMQPKNLTSYPLQSELESKLSDEEKALLEGKVVELLHNNESEFNLSASIIRSSKRMIPLDKELLEEHGSLQHLECSNISQCDDLKQQSQQKSYTEQEKEPNVVYRRLLIPQNLETPTHEHNPLVEDLNKSPSLGDRQLRKLKDNKESNNRNRQSQISVGVDENDPLLNKSSHGKWKRRKGPAPALPIPPRKVIQMLPLQEIKHELEIIEVQQQGLEKQGVILEKMIRDRCEGENGELLNSDDMQNENSCSSNAENSKEVENLILQLFELVNEKNELFRRQAELMYLRRQHRLEQEQADLEYEIRILMAQPERNKTDSDKAREEAFIERLVEVVKLRNEVVECLEMDRLREAEEDQSIKQRLESHIAKREHDINNRKTLTKLSKKEKKKQKEIKKISKSKTLDADKVRC